MKVTLSGASGGEVTGSAYHVQTDRASLLIDFGLFQGGRRAENKNRTPLRCQLANLDAVLLTHGHLDHTGRLPLLVREGYRGPIYCTKATIEMAMLILRDAARLQQSEAQRIDRKRGQTGEAPIEPLYSPKDVENLPRMFRAVPFDKPTVVAPGITARFVEAGHMLGSASIQLTVEENGSTKTVIFSGDLGPKGIPILRDYMPLHKADAVFMESTYGDHDHRPFKETAAEFIEILTNACKTKGKILVPTFAVGRAQLLLTLMAYGFRKKLVPAIPVYLDSPMAIEATRIYSRHRDLFDEQMTAFLTEGRMMTDLKATKSRAVVKAQESMALNDVPGPCMILAGAGMCNAGRILHHLRNNLHKPETAVLIVGYQGEGSLGRQLVDGKKMVSIHGQKVPVKARVSTLGGFSAHAGQKHLLEWFDVMAGCRPRVFLVHGEDRARRPLAALIERRYGIRPELPAAGASIRI